MYAFIRGQLTHLSTGSLVLENQGIGYKILIPVHTAFHLLELGKEILLYTSFVIREFSHTLYGFLHVDEKELFESLIDISGVGPKLALSLVGHLSIPALQTIVIKEDVQALCKIPGIGKKTAERLLVELKGKSLFEKFTTIELASLGE